MFRHDDVIQQKEIMLASSPIEGVNEPLAGSILAEKLVSPITGERQLMCVMRKIEALSQVPNPSV